MKRRVATIGLTVSIMFWLIGCGESYQEKNENMLAHMKEKYGVEFEIQHYIPRNVDCSYDVWYCNAVEDDPELDKIEVHRYYGDMAKDGEYADEYYVKMTRNEVENRAVEAFAEIAGEVKAYVSYLEFADEEYTEIEQLDEFLQTDKGKIAYDMILFIVDKEKEGIKNQYVIDNMTAVIPNAGVGDPWLRIFFVKNEEKFHQIDRMTYGDMIRKQGEERIYTCDYSGSFEIGFEE